MLFTEFKMEEAQQVWFEEGREEGIEMGREEAQQAWFEEGLEKGKLETARAMFADGDSLEKIARNTGMSLESLKEKLHVQ
jgi:predicted transposase/invertase (TIGR01784 family)